MTIRGKFPKTLTEPASYYHGLDVARRPRCNNLLAFLRRDRRSLQQKHLANRSHHRHVLLLVEETAGSIIVDGVEIPLQPGQAYWVKPYQFHHYINLEQDNLRWFFLTFELNEDAKPELEPSRQPILPDPPTLHYWQSIFACISAEDTLRNAEALPLLDALLMSLERQQLTKDSDKTTGTKTSSWTARVETLLLRSVHEDFGVETIAQRMHCSERHLRSRFEKEVGVSPSEYRANYQLHQALSLMREPQLSLGQIAQDCGFNSQPVFNRFIKRKTGQTPTHLRRQGNSPAI